MKDSQPRSDDKPSPSCSTRPAAGGPIGTHSLTGGAINVGIPSGAPDTSNNDAERGASRDVPFGGKEQDPDGKPRDDIGKTLGRKP